MVVDPKQDLRNESEDGSEDDPDYQPGQQSDSESENDQDEGDEVEEVTTSKRKAETDTTPAKRSKTDTDDAERERQARVNAIWAEMKTSQPPIKRIPSTSSSAATNNDPQTPPFDKSPKSDTNKQTPKPAKKPSIARPKSSLSDLVSQYNIKVPKMNTLEKSKLDWQSFVDKEGIKDDLKYQNKDGYMEKVAFLQRVDDRRLTHLKAGQQAGKKKQ